MRRDSLLRSSAFQAAILVSALVILSLTVAGTIAYVQTARSARALYDDRVATLFDSIAQAAAEPGGRGVEELVSTYRYSARQDVPLIWWQPVRGRAMGNLPPNIALPVGWTTLQISTRDGEAAASYRVLKRPIPGGMLTVGRRDQERDRIAREMRGAIGWGLAVALGLALASGALVAQRVRRRHRAFTEAISAIGAGDLAARLPVSRADDDIDRLAHAINEALARLAALVETMQQISTDIAHDLRTPLNRLSLRIDAAHAAAEAGGDPRAELEAATRDCTELAQTFSALLRIAQIEAGARRARFARLDLGPLVAEVCDFYDAAAEDAGMTLSAETPEGAAWLHGDAELLQQLVVNLIENAIRHCPPGTRITCRVDPDPGGARISVRDTGPGIPEAERNRVLRRFYRLEKSRTTAGTGLGLALVQAIADLHGATLVLDDAAPGLDVRLNFPPPAKGAQSSNAPVSP